MTKYVLRRLALAVGQLVALSIVVFSLTAMLPGDAAEVRQSEHMTPEQVAALRNQLGLDRPLWTRFLEWAGAVLHGDLGQSLSSGLPVNQIIGESIGCTAVLAGVTVLLVAPLSTVLGIASAVGENGRLDRVITAVTLGLAAIPDFVLALVFVAVFALQLGWSPATWVGVTDLCTPELLALPVAVLLCRSLSLLTRQVRAGTVTVLHAGYVVQARRLGLPRRTVLLRHVLPNAAVPAVQDLARLGDNLLGGVLLVEAIFAIPGVATALITAVQQRDVPTVQGLTMVLAAFALLIHLLADLICDRLVPRTELLR
ncbi:ABC transporter permease [Pseudonocardiaceae bacterium YIM PH 21723]|nr:ABC transporter permease [Pseudonocardiaceae bacterium YIM PH 21723]